MRPVGRQQHRAHHPGRGGHEARGAHPRCGPDGDRGWSGRGNVVHGACCISDCFGGHRKGQVGDGPGYRPAGGRLDVAVQARQQFGLDDCGNLPSLAQKRCPDPESEWANLRRQGPGCRQEPDVPSDCDIQSSVEPDGCPGQDKDDQPQVVPLVEIAGTYVFPLGQPRS